MKAMLCICSANPQSPITHSNIFALLESKAVIKMQWPWCWVLPHTHTHTHTLKRQLHGFNYHQLASAQASRILSRHLAPFYMQWLSLLVELDCAPRSDSLFLCVVTAANTITNTCIHPDTSLANPSTCIHLPAHSISTQHAQE